MDTDLHNIENAEEQIVSNINKFINLPNEIDSSKKRKSDIFDFKKSNKKKCTEKNIEVSSEDIINNTNVDDNHNIENCSCHLPEHLNYVVNRIEAKDVLKPLIKKLYKGKILDDFLIMLPLISKGILEASNIPLTLATKLAKMHSHKSTTAMVYRPETLDFWSVCYRTCHSSGLNLFSGSKHQGHVIGDKCEMSTYDPSKGSFNFAVPDVKTLLRHEKKVDKFLYAGILNGSFELLDKAKQFVLEYDSKRISCQLHKNNIGDVNLWGYESPSIHELNEQLKCENNLIEELEGIEECYNESSFKLLSELIHNISLGIKKKRISLLGHEKYLRDLVKLVEGNPRFAKKYNKAMHDKRRNIFMLKNWISKALHLNKCICLIMAKINQNLENFCTGDTIDVIEVTNIKLLHDPEILQGK